MPLDIILVTNEDGTRSFQVGESVEKHCEDLIFLRRGELKSAPLQGIGIREQIGEVSPRISILDLITLGWRRDGFVESQPVQTRPGANGSTILDVKGNYPSDQSDG